jgi:hypothetical protein
MSAPRQYRLSPLDTTGWILGLSGEQCVALAVAVIASGLALDAHLPVPLVAAPLMSGLILAFARVGGHSIPRQFATVIRVALMRTAGRSSWTHSTDIFDQPFLKHLEVVISRGTGVVHDQKAQTLTALFTAAGTSFLLRDDNSQDELLAGWGASLTPFAASKAITSISWHEAVSETPTDDGDHELIICVSLDLRRVQKTTTDVFESGVRQTIAEAQLLADNLELSGLNVGPLLSDKEIRQHIATRLSSSPAVHATPPTTLNALVRPFVGSVHLDGEMTKTSIRVGHTHHRAYWISHWPRNTVGASWLEPLLFAEGVTRTLSLHMSPVSALESRRRINRAATKVETDVLQRQRAGFRVEQSHEREMHTVISREAELGDGYAEFTYTGVVMLSAGSREALRQQCATWEQSTAAHGMRLVPLDGRNDLGIAASLPLGQAPKGARL